jgi:hypothetical protein
MDSRGDRGVRFAASVLWRRPQRRDDRARQFFGDPVDQRGQYRVAAFEALVVVPLVEPGLRAQP